MVGTTFIRYEVMAPASLLLGTRVTDWKFEGDMASAARLSPVVIVSMAKPSSVLVTMVKLAVDPVFRGFLREGIVISRLAAAEIALVIWRVIVLGVEVVLHVVRTV